MKTSIKLIVMRLLNHQNTAIRLDFRITLNKEYSDVEPSHNEDIPLSRRKPHISHSERAEHDVTGNTIETKANKTSQNLKMKTRMTAKMAQGCYKR